MNEEPVAGSVRTSIRRELHRSRESRYDYRLHAVLLVCSGRSCRVVAALLDETPRTVQRWIQRFRQHGFEGLRDRDRTGRPRVLSEAQWRLIEQDMRRAPRDFGFAEQRWNAGVLRKHVRMRFAVDFSVRHCCRIMRRACVSQTGIANTITER